MLLRLTSAVSDVDLMRIGAGNPGYRFEREERRLLNRESNFDKRRREKRRGICAAVFIREARRR
jgi:hypothetical protein